MMNKIKVMNVYNNLYYGGTEEYIKQVINCLDKNKFDVSVCCLMERGSNTEWFEKNNIKIYSFNAVNKPSIKYLLRNLSVIIKLIKLLKRQNIDIVHTHDFFPAFITRIACLFAGTKVTFVTLHNLFIWLKPFHHFINRLLSKKTTKIIAVSKSVMERSIKFDKISSNKYALIYNAINTNKFKPNSLIRKHFREEFKIKDTTFVIACVGSFSKRKGQKYLVNAFYEFQIVVSDSALIFIGGGDNNEPEIKEELNELILNRRLNEKIIFTGPRKDVYELLNIADLFVLPSIVEGFGYAAVEAMSLKLPVILSDITTFCEITQNGRFGLLFRSKDENDLLNKIVYGYDNKVSMFKLVEDARNHVVEKFSIKSFENSYQELYEMYSYSHSNQ